MGSSRFFVAFAPRSLARRKFGAALAAISVIAGGLLVSPTMAQAAGAPVVSGTIVSDANGNGVLDATGVAGTADKTLSGVPVSLVRSDNGQTLATTTTNAVGGYEFGVTDLGSYVGDVRVSVNLSSYQGNIYATELASAGNQLVRQGANTAASADFAPNTASVQTINGLVKPVWAASLALAPGAGMGGQSVFTGTGPFDATDGDGQDSSDSNGTVRSGDLINYDWNLSFSSSESLGATTSNAVFEQRLDLSDGAVANFDTIPGVCKGTGSPTSQIIALPSNTVVAPRTAPPSGTTSVVLTCNLGPVGQGTSAILPSTGVWTSPTSTNGGKVATVARAYGVDARGAATIAPSSEIKQGPVTITSAPRYDIAKTALTGPVFGSFSVNGQVVPGQTVDYQITIAADRKVGVEAFTNPVTFTDSIYGQYANGQSNGPNDALIAGMKGYVVRCVPTVAGGANRSVMVLGRNSASNQQSSVVDSGTCSYTRSVSDTGDYNFTLTGVDASGSRYPTTFVGGAPIPANQFYVASYRVTVFIPYTEIDKAQGAATDNQGSLKVSNQVGAFDPKGASGASNYGNGTEPGYCGPNAPTMVAGAISTGCSLMPDGSRSNNVAGPTVLTIASPGWGKSSAQQFSAWNPDVVVFNYGQTVLHDGTAQVQPGNVYGSQIGISNQSPAPLAGAGVCDVFDNTVMKLTTADKNLRDASQAATASNAYAMILENGTAGYKAMASVTDKIAYEQGFQKNFQMRYAHVSLGSDNPNTGTLSSDGTFGGNWSTQAGVNCGDASITWYENPADVPGGIDAVNAVRAIADPTVGYTLPVSGSLVLWIAYEQRNTYNGGPHAGALIPAGTVAANFARVTSTTWNQNWSSARAYNPSPHTSNSDGDRWIVARATMAITKETVNVDGVGTGVAPVGEVGKALAGEKVVWKVNPTITATGTDPTPVDNVVITDTLPQYASYDAVCTQSLTGGTPADTAVMNANGTTTLTWKLGSVVPNSTIAPRLICTELDPLTPNNLGLVNTVTIKADGVLPVPAHTANHTVTVQQGASLALKKEVDRSVDLQNQDQNYTLTIQNFAPSRTFKGVTILETLPYNGDSTGPAGITRAPSSNFSGTNALTGPVSAFDATGTAPVAGTSYYTTVAPGTIPQDLNADTDPAIWSTTVADWSKVTGFKFVSSTLLGNAGSGNAAALKLKFTTKQDSNMPGDWYANRYTAFSSDLLDDAGKYMTLTSNQTNVRILGFSIGDLIWTDNDYDGKYDPAVDTHAPAGVNVEVFRTGDSTPVQTVQTDANGRWHADNLASGQYYVVVPASEFAASGPLAGQIASTINAQDSSVNANEDVDHNAVQDGAGIRSKGLITLAATQTPTTITGNGPLNDNVANLGLPLGTTDDFTNLTIDLALTPVPGYTFTKTADPASGSTVNPGDTITYTLTGSNTGATKLDPVKISDDLSAVVNNATLVPGSLTASLGDAPVMTGNALAWSGSLDKGQKIVITYKVTVNAGTDKNAVTLKNSATSTATPPQGPDITPPPVVTEHLVPGYTFAKTADPKTTTAVSPGQEITYTLTGVNTGATALDPVNISDDLSAVLDNATIVAGSLSSTQGGAPVLTGTTLGWTGSLDVGQSVVVTYKVKVNADANTKAVTLKNLATSTATPPEGPVITPPPGVTEHPVPGYTFAKAADPASGTLVVSGQEITYTLTGSNTGATTLDPVTIDDDLSEVLNNATIVAGSLQSSIGDAPVLTGTTLKWSGTLEVGQNVVLTYKVKVNADADRKAVTLKNLATSTATPPDVPVITPPPGETEHPVPGYTFTKGANPVSGTVVLPGQEITYTLKGTNTGATSLSPVTIDDDLSEVLNHATLVDGSLTSSTGSAPVLTGSKLAWTGALEKGQDVVVTYTVKVNADADKLAVTLKNIATSSATPPEGPSITPPPGETTHPVPGYDFTKIADPVSGTTVMPGGDITYTLTGKNTGATDLDVVVTDDLSKVLDNAKVTVEPVATVGGEVVAAPVIKDSVLSWSGPLASGQEVVITYTVTINLEAAGVIVNNHASSKGTVPGTDVAITPPPVETWHPTPGFTFMKTANPVSGTAVTAGQEITYSLTGTNSGKTALEPVEIRDDLTNVLKYADMVEGSLTATIDGKPATAPTLTGTKLSWTGALAEGSAVVVSYKVKVKADVAGPTALINNVAGATATPPGGTPITPPDVTTEHPVTGFTLAKTSDPVTGSKVKSGDLIKYTVTGTNIGAAAISPVTVSDDMTKVLAHADLQGKLKATVGGKEVTAPKVVNGVFTWIGTLNVGEAVVITYTVKVQPVTETTKLVNVASATWNPPVGPPVLVPPVTTEHEVPPVIVPPVVVPPVTPPTAPAKPPLAYTGAAVTALAMTAGFLVLLGGAGVVFARRRRTR